MRWTVALPTGHVDRPDEFLASTAIGEMARALEAAGADACHVTDHPYPPSAWVAHGGHHAVDPFVALTAAAASTSVLRLHTNVLVLGYRHPILSAHSLATLDAVSGGRVIAGVAVGYLEDEFTGLGVDFTRRGRRLDDALETMRAAWAGAAGPRGNVVAPRPSQEPGPPLWVGGNSPAAMRRVVTHGQGWSPFPASRRLADHVKTRPIADLDDLRRHIAELHGELAQADRVDPVDICCPPFSHPHYRPGIEVDRLLDEIPLLEAAGVTWATIHLAAPSRAAWLEQADQLGREVIAPLAARH